MTAEKGETTEWVHCLDTWERDVGDVIGWPDDRSSTGMLSGIILERDHAGLRVKVRDIRAATVEPFAHG